MTIKWDKARLDATPTGIAQGGDNSGFFDSDRQVSHKNSTPWPSNYVTILATELITQRTYFEIVADAVNNGWGFVAGIHEGAAYDEKGAQAASKIIGMNGTAAYWWNANGGSAYKGITIASGDVLMFDYDPVNQKIWFGVNGVWLEGGDPSNNLNPAFTNAPSSAYPAVWLRDSGLNQATLRLGSENSYTAPAGSALLSNPAPPASGGTATTSYPTRPIPSHKILLAEITLDNNGVLETHYLSTSGFISRPSDALASTVFLARLDGKRLDFSRQVGTHFWGNQSSSSVGALDIINSDGVLDSWLDYDVRDQSVVLRLVESDQSYNQSTIVAQGVIDRLEVRNDDYLRLVMRDKSALLDEALQDKKFPSTVPNSQLKNYPEPICLGTVNFAAPANYDTSNLIYEIHDTDIIKVLEVRDRGVLLTKGVGWDYDWTSLTAAPAVKLLKNPDGQILVKMQGEIDPDYQTNATLSTDVLSGIGSFTTWSSGVPNGWSVTVSGGASITNNGNAARLLRSGSGNFDLKAVGKLEPGRKYKLSFDVNQLNVNSLISLRLNNAVFDAFFVTSTGPITKWFTAAGGTDFSIANYSSFDADLTIDNVIIKAVDGPVLESLSNWVYHIAVTRGTFTSNDVDTTVLDLLEQSAPFGLGFYANTPTTNKEVLDATMRSFGGWWYVNQLGQLTAGRLLEPAGLTSLLTLNDINLIDDVVREPDLAPGLSNALGAERTWTVSDKNSLAGSVSNVDKERMAAQFGFVAVGAGTLDSAYQHAKDACPTPTLLTDQTDAQTEADRWVSLYSKARYFYKVTAVLDAVDAITLEPGECVTLAVDRYGLSAGKKLLVVGVKGQYLSGRVDLLLWG